MVANTNELKIVQETEGKGTGDRLYKTEDGRWWKNWDGIIRTGEEVRMKINGVIK